MSHSVVRAIAPLAALLLLGGCSGLDPLGDPSTPTTSSTTSSTTSTAAPTATSAPTPSQPHPKVGECRAFGLKAAVAPVPQARPRPCRRQHTAQTFLVGRLDLVQGGHRLAVDSPAVQARPAGRCHARLARHLGADPRQLRLTMAQAVWFTPSIGDATVGADWFRCDVVVVAASGELLPLPRRTAGMGTPDRIAMCATAEPGTSGFTRVVCSRRHSWRAVSTVDLAGRGVPGPQTAAARMEGPCRAAARARAGDPLDFEWAQESPTRAQWEAGQRYGICWVPV